MLKIMIAKIIIEKNPFIKSIRVENCKIANCTVNNNKHNTDAAYISDHFPLKGGTDLMLSDIKMILVSSVPSVSEFASSKYNNKFGTSENITNQKLSLGIEFFR
jgi:hypothetical protein